MGVWTASLIRHHDLENYLTPLVRRLGAEHFNLVEAAKRVGGGSRLTIGSTVVDHGVLTDDWAVLRVPDRQRPQIVVGGRSDCERR